MFESILEGLLNKYLGEYVTGLSRDDLSVSIWGGDIELHDIMLKKDIFQKFKMPLELIYGQIGYLRIQCPWRHLGSRPVNVEVRDIWLVVQPKTDSAKWESVETLETSFEKKEELVREMARALFEEMIKTAEEKKKEQGMTAGLITKIVDNMQISLKNLHLRIENEDTIEPDNSFSLGITLQEMDLYTTDEKWQRIYLDRTREENKGKAMNKVLKIHNFGVYYKTKERSLISQAPSDEDRKAFLNTFSNYDDNGCCIKQADDYLVIPIRLEVKLTQTEPESALNGQKALMSFYIALEEFGITIQKGQYDNVQMLLELTSDYVRFLTTDSLKTRKHNMNEMNELLRDHLATDDVTKAQVRELYSDIFGRQLELIVAADPKKPEKLKAALAQELAANPGSEEVYEAILLGISSADLELWAKEVVSEKVNSVKREAELKKQKKGKGFFGKVFGKKEEEKTQQEQQEQLEQLETEIFEHASQRTAISGNQIARKNIPDITFEFQLSSMNLTLVNDIHDYAGVTLQAQDFYVKVNKYDETNKYNSKTIDIDVILENYGLWVVYKNDQSNEIDYSPFMQKLSKIEHDGNPQDEPIQAQSPNEDDEFFDCVAEQAEEEAKDAASQRVAEDAQDGKKKAPLTHICIALGNKEHHISDLEEKDETDLDVVLEIQPIEIIYRAETVGDIARFFKVKKLTDSTKLAAQAQYQKLTDQVEKITQDLNQDFDKNRVKVRIAAPTLVIPFKQKTWEEIYETECWVFTMGDVSFDSYKGAGFEGTTHEAFQLKVERVKFEHASMYCSWKDTVGMGQSSLPPGQSSDGLLPSPQLAPQISRQLSGQDDASPMKLERRLTFENQARLKSKRLRMTKILEDFSASVLLLKKRSHKEMRTPEMLKALLEDPSAAIEVLAQLDDEIQLSLRPAVFQKLMRIGSLFAEGEKPQHYYKNKMLGRLKKSLHHGQVKMVTYLGVQLGTAAIIQPNRLFFWPEGQPENFQEYDLYGCEQSGGFQTTGLDMILENQSKKRCELRFYNHHQTEQWMLAMIQTIQDINALKIGVLGVPNGMAQSFVSLPGSGSEISGELLQESESQIGVQNDIADFGLKFTVPKVCLTLKTRKKAISSQISSVSNEWELQTYLEQISVELQQKKNQLNMKAIVQQLKVADNSIDERFQFIFQNKPVEGQQDLVTFEMTSIEKTSPDFIDCESYINLGFSGLEAYWKPQTMINLLEFINENKSPPKTQQDTNSTKLDKDLDQIKLAKRENLTQNQTESQKLAAQNVTRHKGCIEKTAYLLKVNVKLAYLKAVFIHPDNNTYPIFSIEVQKTGVDYWKKCDHDQVNLRVKNLQVFDNTKYPDTLNPNLQYSSDQEVFEDEILGLNTQREVNDENMLNLTCYLFMFPSEVQCEAQKLASNDKTEPTTEHNLLLEMELQQMRLKFMMEHTLRIVDYSFNFILKLFNTGLMNADILEEEDEDASEEIIESESMSEMQSLCIDSDDGLDENFWATFDLKQDPYCPKLNLKLSCPLIIMPNLSEPTERFELDFGTICITSNLVEEHKRWINHPEKPLRCMGITVSNQDLRFDFKKEDQDQNEVSYQPILKEEHVKVNIMIPGASPFFEEFNDRGAHTKAPVPIDSDGHTFDMNQIDTSISVSIKQSLLKLHLKQDVIIELFKTLEHNIMKKDQYSAEFSHALQQRKATIVASKSISATKKTQRKRQAFQSTFKEEALSDDSEDSKVYGTQEKIKKKNIDIIIQSSCLSIELRKTDGDLIAEFCMVNFDYGLQIFQDGVQRIYMRAYSLFIFHDEDPMGMSKEVMFGHINARNQMVTNDEFYRTLPDKIRQEKHNNVGGDQKQHKPKIDFEMIMDPNMRTQTVKINMRKLKFFMRPTVFNEISEFTILCLKKLDLKKQREQEDGSYQEEKDPMNDSFNNPDLGTAEDKGTTMIINFKLLESIFVLERRELQKKAAVIEMSVEIDQKLYDQRAIERQISGQRLRHTGTSKSRYRPTQEMNMKVLKVTPYVINIRDLQQTKFKQAKKRVLISAFDFQMDMKYWISQAAPSLDDNSRRSTPAQKTLLLSGNANRDRGGDQGVPKKPVMKFKTKSSLEMNMTPIRAQVSMDDLYVVEQLCNKASEEAMEVGKMWQDYQQSSIVTESDIQRKLEQDIPSEDSMYFMVEQGADIVIINEDRGNFIPMFLFSCDKVIYIQNSGLNQEDRSDGNVETKCSLYYFNKEKGYWEPTIEHFSVIINQSRVKKLSNQNVKFPAPININISVHLGGVINDFLKLWEKSQKRAKLFQKRISEHTGRVTVSNSLYKTRQSLFGDSQYKQTEIMLMDSEKALVDCVTPYAIRNLTDRKIKVSSLRQGSDTQDNECKILTGEVKGLAMNFDETLKMSEQELDGRKKIVSKDHFVRVRFESRAMKPIRKFKLNQNSPFVKHCVFAELPANGKVENPNLNREFYVIQNKLEDQRRVLTIRTQHVLTNLTQTTYQVRQFFITKKLVQGKMVKENWTFYEAELPPQQSIPLPDDCDQDVVDKLKICLRPLGCKKWSDEFKISALKYKVQCNKNLMWNHFKTFSILRKEGTDHREVFNYFLLPALIIKNCLPLPVLMRISHVLKTDEERKANNRAELMHRATVRSNNKSQGQPNRQLMGDFSFQRGEERVIDTMDSSSARSEILLHLNDDNFEPQSIPLDQNNERDSEKSIVFRNRNNSQRTFKVYARIDTTIAGLKVVLYAKNVLLCHTEQRISFFYHKNRINDMFNDDDPDFPLPVRDKRHQQSNNFEQEMTMTTDRNVDNEPTIYIHDQSKTMCASLTEAQDVKSGLVPINVPGSTGKFEIPHGDMLFQFQCSTATYQPSEKETLFTRIVEVSPQYIVCNLSKHAVFFCQATTPMDQLQFCIELGPKDRQPFHWTHKRMPKQAIFFIQGAERPSAPFTLADCGSLAVSNIMEQTRKKFFRVTKRVILNSNFIIIEDMPNAPYKIDNLCQNLHIDFYQADAKIKANDIETCLAGQNRPFAWHDLLKEKPLLNVSFFMKNGESTERFLPTQPQDTKRPEHLEYSLDILNRTQEVNLVDEYMSGHSRKVYISVYTDQYQKVFEISDEPSKHIFETEKDKQSKKEQTGDQQLEELKFNDDISISSSVALTTVDDFDEESKGDKADEEEYRTKLEIFQVNISLINKQTEVLTLVLDKWVSMIGQTNQEWIYEATLNRLQMDNHGQKLPLFPVILKPKCTNQGEPHNHFTMEGVQPALLIYISMQKNIPNVQYVNWFEFLLKELELRIELEHLLSIFEFAQDFNEKMEKGLAENHQIFLDTNLTTELESRAYSAVNEESKVHQLNESQYAAAANAEINRKKTVRFSKSAVAVQDGIEEEVKGEELIEVAAEDSDDNKSEDGGEDSKNQLTTWRSQLLSDNMDTVYIEKFKGSPLSIDVSIFKQTRAHDAKQGGNNRAVIVDILSNMGFQFANISGAPIKLNALEIPSVYGSQNVVKGLLLEHYQSNISRNVLKLLGSTDLLGNPTDFVNTLGTGAKEFYYAPKEGFMQGPLQGGLGILVGTKSLVSHTVGGLSGSISKITNTLNRGVLVLSADTEYRQKKEIKDVREKPSGVFDGIGKGFKGFGKSLWSGVSGVVTQPIKGAKQQGILGFGKGMGRGLLGTVVKPVSGVVDLLSKTTEGIESSVDGGICSANDKKYRAPRAFYKDAGIFKEESKISSKLYKKLRATQKLKWPFASETDAFYGAFKLGLGNPDENVMDSHVVMLTSRYLVIFDNDLRPYKTISTTDFMLPTREHPNPIVQENCLRVILSDGEEQQILEFNDEAKALACYSLFEDMFFMLTDQDVSRDD